MKEQFSAGFLLFRTNNKERQYLLLRYPHGHWDLPKGKIEADESKQEAALRELKEETDLAATIIDGFEEQLSYFFRHKGELINKTVYFFIAEAEQGEVTLSDEHIGFAWLSYQEALDRLSFDNAKEILKRTEQFLTA